MASVERQTEMGLAPTPKRVHVPLELIWTRRTGGQAFTLACDASGLEDKVIAAAVGLDKGTFSRIKAGQNTLDADLIPLFCEVVGNFVYPTWIAFSVGHGLHLLKTEAERLLEEREQELASEREKVRLLSDLLRGKAP